MHISNIKASSFVIVFELSVIKEYFSNA